MVSTSTTGRQLVRGLITFMADYFYRAQQSDAAARRMRLNWLRNLAAIPAGAHQSLASFRSRIHRGGQIVGYDKAAMVFVMLCDVTGKDAFNRGIRLFWQHNRFEVASWDNLRRAFEDAADRSLKTFPGSGCNAPAVRGWRSSRPGRAKPAATPGSR